MTVTHEFLALATVVHSDVWLPLIREDNEREVLHISLYLGVIELAADEALRVEDSVDGVHRHLILRGVADEALCVGEGNIRWGGAVALVVGNDLNTIVLPYTDAAVDDTRGSVTSAAQG
jgi:hypothetical protein